MVVDEAHKLRNFYQNKQKSVAKSISQIAQGTYKTLLLTATPLPASFPMKLELTTPVA